MDKYRYTESGLDNIVITGIDVLVADDGEQCVSIPNINGLHKVIAHGIVMRKSGITGKELRFLRTEMGMTQAELAETVAREPLAISRWERGESPMDSNAEAVIRLLAIEKLNLPVERVENIAGWCAKKPEANVQPPLVIDGSDPTNYRLAA